MLLSAALTHLMLSPGFIIKFRVFAPCVNVHLTGSEMLILAVPLCRLDWPDAQVNQKGLSDVIVEERFDPEYADEAACGCRTG